MPPVLERTAVPERNRISLEIPEEYWDELLAELPIRLTVSVRLVRSSDLEDARP